MIRKILSIGFAAGLAGLAGISGANAEDPVSLTV